MWTHIKRFSEDWRIPRNLSLEWNTWLELEGEEGADWNVDVPITMIGFFFFVFFFLPHHMVCGILVPWPRIEPRSTAGIEPGSTAVKAQILTTAPPGKFPDIAVTYYPSSSLITVLFYLSSVQFSGSVVSDSLWPHGLQHARLPSPSPTPGACSNSCPLSQWCHPTISSLCCPLLPPSIFPSIRVFSKVSVLCIRWPKYWSFSFSISPSKEYSGLISFRMNWLDLLAVQGTLKSLQQHSSKASILLCLTFFIVQLSHPYMTTRKTIALTRQTFVGKVMSLLFNMLSRLVVSFPPRSKRVLISQLFYLRWCETLPQVVSLSTEEQDGVVNGAESHGYVWTPQGYCSRVLGRLNTSMPL